MMDASSMEVQELLRATPEAPGAVTYSFWRAKNLSTSLRIHLKLLKLDKVEETTPRSQAGRKRRRPVVLVAGGGWAASSFVRLLDPRQFEVVWISPHAEFSFTPLLPSVVGGVLPACACTTYLRDILTVGGDTTARGRFFQGHVEHVDLKRRVATCRPVGRSGVQLASWEEPFDYHVLAVGSEANTFDTQGVKEHAYFLRHVQDAQRIRSRVAECLEAAASPAAADEQRRSLLTFVIVGGGPTGVESAVELHDYLKTEGRRLYPQIAQFFRVVIVESGGALLRSYDRKVQEEAARILRRSGVELMLNSRVVEVTKDSANVRRSPDASESKSSNAEVVAAAETESIPFGLFLWAAGVQPPALARTLAKTLPQQTRPHRLLVDPSFRVIGAEAEGVFAIGDCCTIAPPSLAQHAKSLFALSVNPKKTSEARTEWLLKNQKRLASVFPQLHERKTHLSRAITGSDLSFSEFRALLEGLDKNYVPPVATAQNAKQEGEFLAILFNTRLGSVAPEDCAAQRLPAFVEEWKGSLCLLGSRTAALQLPVGTFVGGIPAVMLWRLVYFQLQFGARAAWRCLEGWIQTALFGRSPPCNS